MKPNPDPAEFMLWALNQLLLFAINIFAFGFCNYSGDPILMKNSKVALGLSENHQWPFSPYSWHQYLYAIK